MGLVYYLELYSLRSSLQQTFDLVYEMVYIIVNVDNIDYEKILIDSIIAKHYFSNIDLRLNKNYGYLLNNNQLNEYLKFKENYNSSNKTILDLKTFNSKYIYFYNSKELSNYTADYF